MPVIRWFAPVFVKMIEPYVFATPPTVRMTGFLAPTNPSRTDLDFTMQSTGAVTVPLAGTPLVIWQPVANLSIAHQRLQLDVTAGAKAGTVWRDATLRDAAARRERFTDAPSMTGGASISTLQNGAGKRDGK